MTLHNCATKSDSEKQPAEIKVWDLLVRLFHWSLVTAFTVGYLTGNSAEEEFDKSHGAGQESFLMELHENAGYVVLGLVAFRVVWGLVGSEHARFSSFVRGPREVFGYLFDMLRFKAKRYIGHNPAGGAMVVALLVMLVIVSGSGVMLMLDQFKDMRALGEVHEASANITLGLIIFHLVGVLVASVEHRESLVKAMVTGRKRK